MIRRVIHWSLDNRPLVLLLAVLLAAGGLYALRITPLDAIPDLSDVQVIIKTSYPGQAPQVIEDQVTYPLTSALLAVPGATSVRGYSFFGDSYVYVIFRDGTDPYWARSRVLEYLSQVSGRLPAGVRPELGPDASGVGWAYEYVLVDRSGRHDLSQLRSIQDWFLKYELEALPGVAEVASVGGMVKQYQVEVDPGLLQRFNIPLASIKRAIRNNNQDVGGSVIEMAEAEYMVHSHGFITGINDLKNITYLQDTIGYRNAPATLGELGHIGIGPRQRRSVADLDGKGEVVGGIVVLRSGANALAVIERVKARLATLRKSLPPGVEVVETYDRSGLIHRAVHTLTHRLVEEFVVVVAVCALFLFHLRSALVILLTLPLGILAAFGVMALQGINANIMSLGGIAIAVGAMVDAAIVLIENLHRHLQQGARDAAARLAAVRRAATEVGPALFFSLLVITLSFVPVFSLQAQEGRLFAPLAFTKTYAMAAAAGLSVTLVPVLMFYLVRGRIRREEDNPLIRLLVGGYRPALAWVLRHPGPVLAAAVLLAASLAWPATHMGSEFMPALEEGDLLYMPTTLPGISVGKARQLLEVTDRLIMSVPEVAQVFGKVGRADTATDPAPLNMIETTIRLKPESEWRPGMTLARIREALDRTVRVPGLTNAWLMPIEARIDMLATGIKTPVGIKISGSDLKEIERIGRRIEAVVGRIRGTASVLAERVQGARYVDIRIDRAAAAHNWLSVAEIQDIIQTAVGGMDVTESVEGRERYPVNLRYPREYRDSPEKLQRLPIVTSRDLQVQLGDVARIGVQDGPGMIRSENARLNGWVYIDIHGRDLGSYVAEAMQRVQREVKLPPGYALTWSGQYQYLVRAKQRLLYIVPLTLLAILLLLYLTFHDMVEALIVMGTLPLALVGGLWLVYLLHYNFSVAVGVGFIALAGVAAEFGVVMLVYLDQACRRQRPETLPALVAAVMAGAVQRVRPKAMTAAVIVAGLLPIMLGHGAGSGVMQRIAAPMIGGMLTAPLMSMFVVPAAYLAWRRRRLKGEG